MTSWIPREARPIHNLLTFVRRVSAICPLEPHRRSPSLATRHFVLNTSVRPLRPSVARDVLIALGRFDILIALNDAQVNRQPPVRSEVHEQLAAVLPATDPNPLKARSNVPPRNPPTKPQSIRVTPHPERSSNSLALARREGRTLGTAQPVADVARNITMHRSFKRKRDPSPGQSTAFKLFRISP
jgi:hypothetical protein